MQNRSPDVTWHPSSVDTAERARAYGHLGAAVWFTGLSGSGKSTVSQALEARLIAERRHAYVLDGDNLRHGLNGDLGFTAEHRAENLRRVAHVLALFADAGVITLAAFVSPTRASRSFARSLAPAGRFFEVHVATRLEVCEARDPKGLYARARSGGLKGLTGVDAPYEPPEAPECVLDTDALDLPGCVARVWSMLDAAGILSPSGLPQNK